MARRDGKKAPPTRRPEDPAALTEARRARAHEELLDVRRREPFPFVTLEVANPLRGTRYRVYVPAYPDLTVMACECTDFGHRGLGTCKHVEAAREWLGRPENAVGPAEAPRQGPDLTRVWRDIDALQAARARDPRPEALRLRRPGAVLFETSTPF